MTNHIKLFVLAVLVFALPLFAQNEVGLSLNSSELSETTIVDDDGESITIDFDENIGIGFLYNHYWTPSFSTEFAATGFGGDMSLEADGIDTFVVGELKAAAITGMGQWHFNRVGRFSPYLGAGIALIGGELDPNDIADEEGLDAFDLETETTWVAGIGADVRMTQSVFINLDVRYMPWNARPEDDLNIEDSVEIDPMIVSAGVKYRW